MDPDRSSVYGVLVMHAVFQGDPTAALRCAEKRFALDPRNPDVHNNAASLYLSLLQPAKSIELLNKALALTRESRIATPF